MSDDAVRNEANGTDTIGVEWNGAIYKISADPNEWSVDVTLAFEEGKAASGVRGLLGPEQWATFMATKPKNRDLSDMFALMARELGFATPGE